ncbi:MAG TPA: ABC transporter permease [Rhodothermales bacterium]|nr:ABC transporter permease [Rhodothermales bacterium]
MRSLLIEIWESLLIAWRTIRINKMRTVLTSLGIIIGITSVTAMATIINGIEHGLEHSLSELGTDVLYVEKWPWTGGPDFHWWDYINRPRITEDLAEPIAARSKYAVAVAPVAQTRRNVKYKGETLTGISIEGSTASYERVHEVNVAEGRFYNALDDQKARNVAVIGATVAEKLFPLEAPLRKTIRIDGHPFQVIGVMKKFGKGLFGDSSVDTQVKIPFNSFQRLFGTNWRSVSVQVKVGSEEQIAPALDELTGILRAARKLDAREEDDFVINEQRQLREQIAPVKFAIFGIGLFLTALALLVGGIGVMNIMFVSVKERTREIGIRKAIGARRRTILIQFLIEAIILCCIGGLIGVGISMGLTGLINLFMPALLPVSTVMTAFGICIAIGITFGLAPAWRAARSEPIEALRYE